MTESGAERLPGERETIEELLDLILPEVPEPATASLASLRALRERFSSDERH